MTHGSLFSGIGGFDLGAERAGLQNLWACEIDEFKQAILRKHFPDTQIYSDVTTLNPPYVDVISGGFPCQDISVSQYNFQNNKYGEYGIRGKRSGLWSEYARIIGYIRPKYVIIENSPMLPVLFFLKNPPIYRKLSKFFLAENQQVKRKSRKKLQKILDNVGFCRIFALSNLKKTRI